MAPCPTPGEVERIAGRGAHGGTGMVDDELRVIGNVEIRAAGAPVELAPQLAKALAVLVAARPGQGVTRSELTDALWPSAPAADRLSAVVSKLRGVLGRVGLTISPGRGHAGYALRGLTPDGVQPAEILDVTALGALVDRGECLLEAARPVEALRPLAAAAARWRGAPFTVGDDWPLPWLCRAAAERLDLLQRRLARAWARAGLLAGEPAALDWIDRDEDLAAALENDREVWLLRFVTALAAGEPAAAEALLEERRPRWGYDDPMIARGAQLLELHERGARLAPPARTAPPPGPHHAALTGYVASVPRGDADLLRLVGPPGPARTALVDELVALAASAGVRVVHAVCDAADDLAPGRPLMRDLWAVALTDPQFPPDTHRQVLTTAVANPRPTGPGGPRTAARLVDAAVALVAALARTRPVLIVIDDAHLLTPVAAGMTERIRERLAGAAAGFAVPGADSGPFAGRDTGSVLAVPDGPGAAHPDADGWLAAAAVTADGAEIDPVAVAAVLGVPAARADAGLAAAVRSGAVRPGDPPRFAGPQPPAQALAGLATDPGRSRQLHRAAHHHLTGGPGARGVDPARVARHALAARPDLDDDAVAAACLAAARGERAARRYAAAVEFAERGLALTDDPQLRFDLQIVQGDARYDRADMRAAETAYRAAYDEAGDAVRRRAVAAVRVARRWTDPGRVDGWLLRMLHTTRDALAGAADPASVELSLLLSSYLAHYTTMALLPTGAPDERPAGVELARRTLAELPADADPEVACEVLTQCRYALFDFAAPAELRALSARLEGFSAAAVSVHLRGDALVQSVVDHMRLGDMVAAHRTSELHRALVEDVGAGAGMGPWQQLSIDTVFDLWDGDLADAEARILGPQKDMLDARPRDVSDSMQQTWMGQLSWLRYQQGRMPELAGILRLAERRQYFVLWAPAIALMWAEVGQPAAAVDQLAATLDLTDDLTALPPHGLGVPTLAVAAEAIDSLDGFRADRLDVDGLARRVDALLEPHTDEIALGGWPTMLFGPVHRARGLMALATGEPDRALEHFELGIRRVGGSAGQLAWLRLHQGRALLARDAPGDARRARKALGAALDTATAKGIGALAGKARRHLGG
jgi:AAA ATPase-like protein